MEQLTIKQHLSDLQVSTSRMLAYNSNNPELLAYFRDITFKLEMIEKLLDIDWHLDWNEVNNAITSALKLDSELTDIDVRLMIKPFLSERKVAKINAKLY
jgi:hypothetical protein